MTFITKPLSGIKPSQLKEPLVENAAAQPAQDVESGAPPPKFIILGARARRITTSRTICLLITALFVTSVSIMGGVCIYRQFTCQQFQGLHFWCKVPYGTSAKYVGNRDYQNHQESIIENDGKSVDEFAESVKVTFRQDFELDLENESFEKIEVPSFKNIRNAIFIHDFHTNKTGILDMDYRRCFVMPLNRERVLMPRQMSTIINQMLQGLYLIDTEIVREPMEVQFPAILNFVDIGPLIERDCKHFNTYMLRRRSDGIVKRSISQNEPVFAEFAGSKIMQLEIDTSGVDEYEKLNLPKN